MRYIVTISHAVPPQFLFGIASNIKGLNDDPPTYYEALQLIVGDFDPKALEALLGNMFILGNVDDAEMLPDRLAYMADDQRQYRMLGNRSLSVGDVIVLTPVDSSERASAWICAPEGWLRMERIPEVVPTPVNDSWSAAHRAQFT